VHEVSVDGGHRRAGVTPLVFLLWDADTSRVTSRWSVWVHVASDAGVQKRQVRLAEMTGALFAEAFRGILQGLNLTPAQRAAAPELVRTHMLAIDAQLAS
jgi:hypothetical protein